jgi:hypothetical protein
MNKLGQRDSMTWQTFQSMLQGGAKRHTDKGYQDVISDAYRATDQFMAETMAEKERKDAETKKKFEEQRSIEEDLY